MKTTTIYQKSIKDLSNYPYRVLKDATSKKLGAAGRLVQKGKLKGARVFTLTLTERETCQKDCHHWETCYGNNMPFAHRFRGGVELEERIRAELKEICAKHEKVLVRLHVLGDFYSPEYVYMWTDMMIKYPNLNVWGYTHVTEFGNYLTYMALHRARRTFGDRWAVRWSDRIGEEFSANSEELTDKGITCPEQLGKTKSCTTCALCWDKPEKQIRFLTH
jgi:hypothetical protein